MLNSGIKRILFSPERLPAIANAGRGEIKN